MNSSNTEPQKYATFELRLEREHVAKRVKAQTFLPDWNKTELQPALVRFLGRWHGSEVRRMQCYVESNPLKIVGVVEFFTKLRHQIDPSKLEPFEIEGYEFMFVPSNCGRFENQPFERWGQIHHSKKLLLFSPENELQPDAVVNEIAVSESKIPTPSPSKNKSQADSVLNEIPISESKNPPPSKNLLHAAPTVDDTIKITNALKAIFWEVYKEVEEKKQKNQTRLNAIRQVGQGVFDLFGHTCNVFIAKDSENHKIVPDFYGVLFEGVFTVPKALYRIFVFREGTCTTISKCRKERHWFALGEGHDFALLSFWKKRQYTWRYPKRPFNFRSQGDILSQKQLEDVLEEMKKYFKKDEAKPEINSKTETKPTNEHSLQQ